MLSLLFSNLIEFSIFTPARIFNSTHLVKYNLYYFKHEMVYGKAYTHTYSLSEE